MKFIALITGASSGIGREFAVQIIENYPSLQEIWVIARRTGALQQLQEAFPEKTIRVFSMDLSKESSYLELEELLKTEQPCIRILVNSAGLGKNGPVARQDWKSAETMVDVNCKALTTVTMLCLPYLRKGSRILQMASASGFLPQPGFAIYAASKSYVLSFSQALSAELAKQKITVTAVCPGPVDTEFFETGNIHIKAFKKAFLIKPAKVVRKALLDAEAGRDVSVCSFSIQALRLAAKLLPSRMMLKLMQLVLS